VAPADLATIYNVAPLYTAKKPITGKGVSVVVLEDGAINRPMCRRSARHLPVVLLRHVPSDPSGSGLCGAGGEWREGEAALDAEWAGAVAPDADVYLASCSDTTTNFGGFIAAQNLLDSAPRQS